MTTLTVLGGGQLGRMLALAAAPLGVRVRTLDPSPDASAGAVSELTVGELGDVDALRAAADGAHVVTYEWEGVPADAVRALEAEGRCVRPSTRALEISQDRVSEKTTFGELGIPVSPFCEISTETDLRRAVDLLGTPAILKTRRGGYDGKGQAVIATDEDVDTAWRALSGAKLLVLEAYVPFDRELSIIAVRGVDGEVRTWPLVQNEHRGGILRLSRAPAPHVTAALQSTADAYARALLEAFDYVGVLTVELFQVGDALLANEMAPRVHNSGHWTIEGSVTSQFENHVRAVLGWPLGATDMVEPSAMLNLIGTAVDPGAVLAIPGAHLHRYAKDVRPGRKVGHITVTATDESTLDARLAALRRVVPFDA